MQYAVAFFPDGTLNATLIGPFNSKGKAEEICEDLVSVEESSDRQFGFGAQVIPLRTFRDATERL